MADFSFDNLVKQAEALEKKRVSEKAELGGETSSTDDKKTDAQNTASDAQIITKAQNNSKKPKKDLTQ